MWPVRILGTGAAVPERVLGNADLERMVDTSDEWITTRTGIRTRRIASGGERTHLLAARAAGRAMEMAGVAAADIGLLVVATITPPMLMPSCACLVQAEIGAGSAFAYDINAACSGFLYGLDLAGHYLAGREDLLVLLVGAETLSTRVDWTDRNTCILFGDGAGAVVLGRGEGESRLGAGRLFSDGRLWELLYMEAPESLNPGLVQGSPSPCIRMTGREVFKYAVRAMEEAVRLALADEGVSMAEVDLVVPHQANVRILRKLMERLGMPEEKVFINVDRYGNTSAASIPIALDEANRSGRLRRGDRVLLCSFGGGFTWGATLLTW